MTPYLRGDAHLTHILTRKGRRAGVKIWRIYGGGGVIYGWPLVKHFCCWLGFCPGDPSYCLFYFLTGWLFYVGISFFVGLGCSYFSLVTLFKVGDLRSDEFISDLILARSSRLIFLFVRSRHRRCSIKKVSLKISQTLQKNTCMGACF